jgi:hypothetical protein
LVEVTSVEEGSAGPGCVGGSDGGEGIVGVEILSGRDDVERGLAVVVEAVGEVVICAKVELGRIHERKSMVEDRGMEFAHRHLLLVV